MAEDLSQADIDRLMASFGNEPSEIAAEEAEAIKLRAERCRRLYKQLMSAIKRYGEAMENGEPEHVVRELRQAWHYYAFKNWLEKKEIDKDQYYALMRKEMKKRGMR